MGLRVSVRLAALLRCTLLPSEIHDDRLKNQALELCFLLIPSALCQLGSYTRGRQ